MFVRKKPVMEETINIISRSLRQQGFNNQLVERTTQEILTEEGRIKQPQELNTEIRVEIENLENEAQNAFKTAFEGDHKQLILFAHFVAAFLQEKDKGIIRTGHELWKVINRRQFSDEQLTQLLREVDPTSNHHFGLGQQFDQLIKENEQLSKAGGQAKVIDLHPEIEKRLPGNFSTQLTRDFSENEVKSLHAIIGIFNQAKERETMTYIREYDEWTLEFEMSQYYEFFGLPKKEEKDGYARFDTRGQNRARTGLVELSNRKFIIPEEYNQGDVHVKKLKIRSLIDIKEISEHTKHQGKAYQAIAKTKHIKISIDGIFLKDFEQNFFRLPIDLNKQIAQTLGVKRVSSAVQFFIINLYALAEQSSSGIVEQTFESLIETMRLEKAYQQRRKKRVQERIDQAIACAIDLGVITKYERAKVISSELDIFRFYLSPELMN